MYNKTHLIKTSLLTNVIELPIPFFFNSRNYTLIVIINSNQNITYIGIPTTYLNTLIGKYQVYLPLLSQYYQSLLSFYLRAK